MLHSRNLSPQERHSTTPSVRHSTSPHRLHSTSPHRLHSTSPRRRHSTSPRQIDNSSTGQQQSDNGGLDSETNETKLAFPWFRKSPLSNDGYSIIMEEYKTNKIRLMGGILIFVHIIILSIYSGFVLARKGKKSIEYYITYGSFLVIGVCYLLRYMDNVELLFSSKFEKGKKGRVRYFGSLLFEVLILNGLQIAGLVYQFIDGKQRIVTFVFGILIVVLRPIGNTMLIVGKKIGGSDLTVNDSTVNDSTVDDPVPASNSEDSIELQLYNQTSE